MKLKKYYKIITYKRISGIVISLTAILSILIVLITLYGSQVGNFVISIEQRNRFNLALYETIDTDKSFSRLTAKGIKGMRESTYADIPDDISDFDGENNHPRDLYLAYTFYLKNMTNDFLEYDTSLTITKATQNIDSAIRIMVIYENERYIYAQPITLEDGSIDWINRTPETHLGEYDYSGKRVQKQYETIPFISAVTVHQDFKVTIKPNQMQKYTVVFWLEGMDEQCTENLRGATLKAELQFSLT